MSEYEDLYFAEIPRMESADSTPQFFRTPPRTRDNYSGYNSIGNVIGRANRAATVHDIENYYYGGEEKEYLPQITSDLKYEIRELKLQHKYLMFFIVFITFIMIFGKPQFFASQFEHNGVK
jgi:hypothetical protein